MAKIEIDKYKAKEPYVLDTINGQNNLVALTEKNANFIEAVIGLDSNYKRETETAKHDVDFRPEDNASDSGGLYCGSQKYWFAKMNESQTKEEFKTSVLGAVIAIDRANATHLETTKDGRKKMRDIICAECKNVDDLKTKLEEKYNPENNHILNKMMKEPFPLIKGGVKFNISFASKFCSIAAEELGTRQKYSKYDGVVSSNLPYYVKVYLEDKDVKKYVGEKFKKSAFQIPQDSGKDDDTKKTNRAELYKKYSDCIADIIKAVKAEHRFEITREQLDHIIWYAFK